MKQVVKRMFLEIVSRLWKDEHGKIVFYHDICDGKSVCKTPTELAKFLSQVDMACKMNWSPVSKTPDASRAFQVALDDGFRGVYDCRDAFISRGIFPTTNLVVDFIGKPGYLNKSEIIELQSAGFRFQSHTWSHARIWECDERQLWHELYDSRVWLEDFLQQPVEQICFPRGHFSQKIYDLSLKAGYSKLVGSIPGTVCTERFPHLEARYLAQDASPSEFMAILCGGMNCLARHYFNRQFKEGIGID